MLYTSTKLGECHCGLYQEVTNTNSEHAQNERLCSSMHEQLAVHVSSYQVMAAPKRQAKLIALLPTTSEASTRSSNCDEGDDAVMPLTKKAKHRESGFDPAWNDEFTWIHVVEDHEGQGMVCSLCRKHNQTTKRMVWIELPCRLFRKDKILQHQQSKCHMDSILAESHAAASRVSGGIRSALQEQVSMQRMGVISALKCLYWLVKEEIARTP